jgi:hypothetical protein
MHHAPRRLKEQNRVIFDVCRLATAVDDVPSSPVVDTRTSMKCWITSYIFARSGQNRSGIPFRNFMLLILPFRW